MVDCVGATALVHASVGGDGGRVTGSFISVLVQKIPRDVVARSLLCN